jgi:hypothetical protein
MTSFSVGIALKANARDAHTGCSARVGLLMKCEREIRDLRYTPVEDIRQATTKPAL